VLNLKSEGKWGGGWEDDKKTEMKEGWMEGRKDGRKEGWVEGRKKAFLIFDNAMQNIADNNQIN
jgi:hypothetical protein